MKTIKQLTFNEKSYPEVISVISKLSNVERRKPHDTASNLLIEAGNRKIKELQSPIENKTPSVAISNPNRLLTACQEENHGN